MRLCIESHCSLSLFNCLRLTLFYYVSEFRYSFGNSTDLTFGSGTLFRFLSKEVYLSMGGQLIIYNSLTSPSLLVQAVSSSALSPWSLALWSLSGLRCAAGRFLVCPSPTRSSRPV